MARSGRSRRRLWVLLPAGLAVAAGAVVLARSHPPAPSARRPHPASRPSSRSRLRPDLQVPVPILMYHVIAPPPADAPFPGLYVPAPEFAAQMQALRRAGYHTVTLDQVWAAWHRGVPLPTRRPIVLTFDNGYRTQYTRALPVLRRLGWVGVENLQLSGLPPSQGGLPTWAVRALVAAGWELDTQGFTHADLVRLGPSALQREVAVARAVLRGRFRVPVDWFCYPSGRYDAAVIAAVRAAGYRGSTTVAPGWAQAREDPFRLPRLRVPGGTTPQQLVALIRANAADPAPPASHGS